jgi:CyaY protein
MTDEKLDEKRYRQLLDDTFARVDRAFEEVDPDLAEVTIAQGALTVLFHEKVRLMLTPQPAVRQLWVAFRDRAWHFDWNAARGAWLDDRGLGLEVLALVEDTTRETVGVEIRVARGPEA